MNIPVFGLSNYEINELIHSSDRTLVYRGRKTNDGQPTVIKLMQREYPTFNELVQFRNQYAIASNLDVEGIVKPYALERYQNRYALTMEDFGGISLEEYYQHNSPTIPEFLSLGIQLSQILHQLHQNRVIHKDIKPANILIHPETQEVKLIDFSISSLLPKETQTLQTPNVLEGTLAYISPEQTGRMNRGIDYRTDFYSLGVTFYQLLNGNLPFETNDALEQVHCHIAKMPAALGKRQEAKGKRGEDIPGVLSDIVLKLMAKNAEDRYQSSLGLKYDLEKCLVQWEENGNIETFELGERDLSDRFLIPEKLYGRETEVQVLLDAFERVSGGNSELLLVAGYSGVGKTAVVNEAHKPITEKRGYFIKGKFDQFQRNIPFFAFVQAFRELMRQLLAESDAQLENWKKQILEAVGDNGQVIIEVIPELEAIIGKQPLVPQLEGSAAQNRFNLLFPKFFGVFTSKKHPLTLSIDDLQWADSASLSLLKLLMKESDRGYLLILGAYRDNEVFPAHPLMLTLEEIQQNNAAVQTLTLAPLDEFNIDRLVADTLLCSTELAAPLSELVYQKTGGNPFFTTQFLKGLHEDNWIVFDREARYWQCDLVEVRQLALTDNVVEFMTGRLHKLPEETQDVLKLAACIGARFDLATLAVVCEQSQERVAADLWPALQEDFVIPKSHTYKFFQGDESEETELEEFTVEYRFLHDRVQQAAYSFIREEEKQLTHLKIGQLLLEKTPENKKAEKLFDIVNQINIGLELITDESERDRLASLNLEAGTKAKLATAYTAALKYFDTGLGLLPKDCWQKCYSLALKLHENAAEAAYLTGNVEPVEELVQIVTVRAKSCLDRVKILQVKMQCCAGQNQPLATIEIARNLLEEFGIVLPESPTMEDVKEELENVKNFVAQFSLDEIAELPAVTNLEHLATASTLMLVGAASAIAAPNLFFLIIFAQVKFSLKYGNSPYSIYGYSCYGMILSVLERDLETAYQFGQLALKLREKSDSNIAHSKAFQLVGLYIIHGKSHVKETLKFFDLAYTSGLESGDFEFAGYSRFAKCQNLYFLGLELSEIEKEISKSNQALSSIEQKISLSFNRSFKRAVIKLLGRENNPHLLGGDSFDSHEFVGFQERANNKVGLYCFYFNQAILMYLFGYNSQSLENSKLAEKYLDAVAGFLTETVFYFYDSLIHLGCIERLDNSVNSDLLIKVSENQKKLKISADCGPMNFKHKYDLVCAEERRISGDILAAMELYDSAIASAKENGYIQEEALANELAAKFYLHWGKEKVAKVYMEEAYYCYARWGAKAKTDQLEAKYPQLLTFQQAQFKVHSDASSHPTLSTVASSASSLDLAAAIKASRAISGEIELDSLLRGLIQIVLENAGADKGTLILNNSDNWVVAAQCDRGNCYVLSVPFDGANNLPHAIVNTVKRTRQTILVNDIEEYETSIRDPYFIENRPKSLCCLPILQRGQLLGILYLENNFTAGAFTSDRLEILNLLTAQAAISIENARLYKRLFDYSHDLEAQVEARTGELQEKNQDLQKALKQLQQTQTQLIHTEKMSALGQMVAGVAHEINNPVNFIAGNIGPTREYVGDLLDLLALYEEKADSAVIEEKAEEIDLEYLRSDLAKILDSMQGGSDRIAQIVLGLRNFSRLGESQRKRVDLRDGLENTLLILQHRLLGSEERPEIAIVKNYGQLPPIDCYPSQLNQVFFQIIGNAIDALRESQAREGLEIRIATEMPDPQTVRVRIADNGPGMSESVRQKAFDPFFTTKPVGRGTGLGLSISYQIVIEQHGGRLQCVSELGKGTEFIMDIPSRY